MYVKKIQCYLKVYFFKISNRVFTVNRDINSKYNFFKNYIKYISFLFIFLVNENKFCGIVAKSETNKKLFYNIPQKINLEKNEYKNILYYYNHMSYNNINYKNTVYNPNFPNLNSDVLIYLTMWQYWWWFWFIFLSVFYYTFLFKMIFTRQKKFNPRINTSIKSHGKWGDLIVGAIPVYWCLNILVNSNFLLKTLEWQTETNIFTVRIKGKQWYWIYKTDVFQIDNLLKVSKNVGRNNIVHESFYKNPEKIINYYTGRLWYSYYFDKYKNEIFKFNKNKIIGQKKIKINKSAFIQNYFNNNYTKYILPYNITFDSFDDDRLYWRLQMAKDARSYSGKTVSNLPNNYANIGKSTYIAWWRYNSWKLDFNFTKKKNYKYNLSDFLIDQYSNNKYFMHITNKWCLRAISELSDYYQDEFLTYHKSLFAKPRCLDCLFCKHKYGGLKIDIWRYKYLMFTQYYDFITNKKIKTYDFSPYRMVLKSWKNSPSYAYKYLEKNGLYLYDKNGNKIVKDDVWGTNNSYVSRRFRFSRYGLHKIFKKKNNYIYYLSKYKKLSPIDKNYNNPIKKIFSNLKIIKLKKVTVIIKNKHLNSYNILKITNNRLQVFFQKIKKISMNDSRLYLTNPVFYIKKDGVLKKSELFKHLFFFNKNFYKYIYKYSDRLYTQKYDSVYSLFNYFNHIRHAHHNAYKVRLLQDLNLYHEYRFNRVYYNYIQKYSSKFSFLSQKKLLKESAWTCLKIILDSELTDKKKNAVCFPCKYSIYYEDDNIHEVKNLYRKIITNVGSDYEKIESTIVLWPDRSVPFIEKLIKNVEDQYLKDSAGTNNPLPWKKWTDDFLLRRNILARVYLAKRTLFFFLKCRFDIKNRFNYSIPYGKTIRFSSWPMFYRQIVPISDFYKSYWTTYDAWLYLNYRELRRVLQTYIYNIKYTIHFGDLHFVRLKNTMFLKNQSPYAPSLRYPLGRDFAYIFPKLKLRNYTLIKLQTNKHWIFVRQWDRLNRGLFRAQDNKIFFDFINLRNKKFLYVQPKKWATMSYWKLIRSFYKAKVKHNYYKLHYNVKSLTNKYIYNGFMRFRVDKTDIVKNFEKIHKNIFFTKLKLKFSDKVYIYKYMKYSSIPDKQFFKNMIQNMKYKMYIAKYFKIQKKLPHSILNKYERFSTFLITSRNSNKLFFYIKFKQKKIKENYFISIKPKTFFDFYFSYKEKYLLHYYKFYKNLSKICTNNLALIVNDFTFRTDIFKYFYFYYRFEKKIWANHKKYDFTEAIKNYDFNNDWAAKMASVDLVLKRPTFYYNFLKNKNNIKYTILNLKKKKYNIFFYKKFKNINTISNNKYKLYTSKIFNKLFIKNNNDYLNYFKSYFIIPKSRNKLSNIFFYLIEYDNKITFKFSKNSFKPYPNNMYFIIKQTRTPLYTKSSSDNTKIKSKIFYKFNNIQNMSLDFTKQSKNFLESSRRLTTTNFALVMPSNLNMATITNSYDVIHSWFIPGIGIKMDCVPGRSTHHTFFFDIYGLFLGQCAEVCGRFHHHMPIRIALVHLDTFILWVNNFLFYFIADYNFKKSI